MRKFVLLWLLLAAPVGAQERPPFCYMVAERFIHKLDVPIDEKHREEHRYYVSQVTTSGPPPAIAADNFAAQVVGELLEGLLSVRSEGDGIELFGFATAAEAEASRLQTLEGLKAHGGNVYTFTWTVRMPVPEPPPVKHHFGEPEPKPKPPEELPKANAKLLYRAENEPSYDIVRPRRERF